MKDNYRVHYKKGDVEVEVESTDKNYIDQMLHKLVSLSPKPIEPQGKGNGKGNRKGYHRQRGRPTEDQREGVSTIDVADIAAKIHDSDKFQQIEKNILNKNRMLPRVLLAFHFAHENGAEFITTGDVEAITDQLRIKIAQPNVSHCISNSKKYFTAGRVRKKGAKVPYKLNRQGIGAFQKCLAGEKI
jgi:hypothetical protein